jgi:endonuclease III-like uncharacterized protein
MNDTKRKIYSEDLEIDLRSGRESELFKWFFACVLFGKPIQQEVVKKTYFEFKKEGLLTLQKILESSWDKLVEVLDSGHYVRFDFSTATKLQEISKELQEKYGNVSGLLRSSKDENDLLKKLYGFKGIGAATARIFCRDLKKYGIIS